MKNNMGLFGILMMIMVTSDIKTHILVGDLKLLPSAYLILWEGELLPKMFIIYPRLNK